MSHPDLDTPIPYRPVTGGLRLPQLDGLEPGLVVEWLYESIGTPAVLVHLEALHRRDAQRAGETIAQPGDHTQVARALRAARVVSDDAATRLQRKVGG